MNIDSPYKDALFKLIYSHITLLSLVCHDSYKAVKSLKEFTIIGYGNQAKAWASNLKDSGVKVYIGLRENSPSLAHAQNRGFETFIYTSENIKTDFCDLLTPDDTHHKILKSLPKHQAAIIFAHGFSVEANKLNEKYSPLILLAPKAIASELRFRYENKEALTAFYSLEYASENYLDAIKEIANKLGMTNFYPSSFKEETQADLFSEQTLLCSTLPYSILLAYNALIEKGYSKEIAFYECFYESKLIIDTILKVGPQAFFELISPNALIGSQIGRDRIFDSELEEKFKTALLEIQQDDFYHQLQQVDIDSLKNEVKEFWKNQDLQKTYESLKDTL